MTYDERYSRCNTIEELERMVSDDIIANACIGGNTDYFPMMEKAIKIRLAELESQSKKERDEE